MISGIFPYFIVLLNIAVSVTADLAINPNRRNVSEPGPSSYVLACGAIIEGADTNGRQWLPDSKSVAISGDSVSATAQYQDPNLPSQVPYMTARIFSAELNYTFPVVSDKRLWIRFHFYPSSYLNLDPGDSYFSVMANNVSLLRNFSAALTAEAYTQAYIVKEFSISPIGGSDLILSLKPCLDRNGSYGFVNGIEVVPMPDIFMGSSGEAAVIFRKSAAESMFRLNIGGQFIPATSDSGLTRTWYDDLPYLVGTKQGVTMEAGKNLTIQYPEEVPEYIAPRAVYRTARWTGSDISERNRSLTWLFRIDANFTYIVRFHFCELLEVAKPDQRVFDVVLNDRTVQLSGDVFSWAGGSGIPVFKDFTAYVGKAGGGEGDLRVALRPSESNLQSDDFLGAILNGVEIFKANDTKGNLAGLNPVPSKMRLEDEAEEDDEDSEARLRYETIGSIAGGLAGGVAGCAVVVAALFFVVYRSKKRVAGIREESGPTNWLLPLYGISYASNVSGRSTSSHLSSLANLCRHFSLVEIRQGCNNFDETQVVGVGGFGKVYRGTIDGSIRVAIKRLNASSEQGFNEFQTEIEMLSKLRHKHLVSLIGFCFEAGEMILVYEYMANGTLRDHICNGALTWRKRLHICIGAARGLHYLHAGTTAVVIHRDVKTTNILLDDNWEAKVSDFGLSKTGPTINQTHVSTMVKGSFGYLDPEYFRRQKLTDKSDVYSFGVLLFEVLCSRPALSPNLPRDQVNLADWVVLCMSNGVLDKIVDPNLKDEIGSKSFCKYVETAERCLADQGTDRPSMRDVVLNLEFALQLHIDPDASSSFGSVDRNKGNEEDIVPVSARVSIGETGESSVVFSQLVKPLGR